ncbi:MAG: tRNA-uridine aminocarboxypropyltransferase [Cellvibrionaceae bacterium]
MSTSHCSRCLLRQDLCLCHQAPVLSKALEDFHLVLLTHTDELRKVTNTGRLLERALPRCEVWPWQRTEFEGRWQSFLKNQSRSPILLFPTDEVTTAAVVELESFHSIGEKQALMTNHIFVLVDATWQQAKKMLRQSTSLQACPRLSLSIDQESQYSLRRNQSAGNVSTVETGYGLLREFALEADADRLQAYFERFLRHSEANRSGYTLANDGSDEGY